MASRGFFYKLRILALLLVLFAVAMNAWLTRLRTTDWDEPLWVVVYPVNGDNSHETQNYISRLTRDTFAPVETFFASEANRYRLGLREPVTMKLAAQVRELPPVPPTSGNPLSIAWWSLKMRYWAWRHDNFDGPSPDVRMYVVYHDPGTHTRLRHSLGLQKGLIGVVHAFASPRLAGRNQVVIAHEFLHTVGATDKYDPATDQPIFPVGYAEPDRQPRYPQRYAEIMGGRIPLSATKSVMPESLTSCRVGPATAMEIRWRE